MNYHGEPLYITIAIDIFTYVCLYSRSLEISKQLSLVVFYSSLEIFQGSHESFRTCKLYNAIFRVMIYMKKFTSIYFLKV